MRPGLNVGILRFNFNQAPAGVARPPGAGAAAVAARPALAAPPVVVHINFAALSAISTTKRVAVDAVLRFPHRCA